MQAIRILNTDQLDELVLLSAWCLEGVEPNQENIDYLEKELHLDAHNIIYYCFGTIMNQHYSLTDDNAYPGDYPFIFVYDYYDVETRIRFGAQWFDVIVENNLVNQAYLEQNGGLFGQIPESVQNENNEEVVEEVIEDSNADEIIEDDEIIEEKGEDDYDEVIVEEYVE